MSEKIYVLTEEAMQGVTETLCSLSKELNEKRQSGLVCKAINTLAQAPSMSKTSRVDELVRVALYTFGGGGQ